MVSKGINAWSFPGGLEGALDPREAIALARKHGFEALELCISESGPLGLGFTAEEAAEVRKEADQAGVRLLSAASGLYWGRALGDSSEAARLAAVEDLRQMIRITFSLGAKTLLTIPGAVDVFFDPSRSIMDLDLVLERARGGLQAVLPEAEKLGVRLGIENVWNRLFMTPTELRAFIDSFESPAIGAYVDVANLLPFGYPDQWLRILGPRVVGIHFKDFRRAVGTVEGFVDLLEGDVDWPQVMAAISQIGYDGPVVAEMIPLYRHYPEVRVANTSRAMDAILGRG